MGVLLFFNGALASCSLGCNLGLAQHSWILQIHSLAPHEHHFEDGLSELLILNEVHCKCKL